jgi:hypothetical protein
MRCATLQTYCGTLQMHCGALQMCCGALQMHCGTLQIGCGLLQVVCFYSRSIRVAGNGLFYYFICLVLSVIGFGKRVKFSGQARIQPRVAEREVNKIYC